MLGILCWACFRHGDVIELYGRGLPEAGKGFLLGEKGMLWSDPQN
jgi:hypothetical protein